MPLMNWDNLLKEAGEQGKAFEPLPNGDYDFIITESEHKISQAGNLTFKFTAEIERGDFAKRKVWPNITLTQDNPKAIPWFFKKMTALGLDENFFRTNPSEDQIASALIGKRFFGKTEQRPYGEGKISIDIKEYKPARGAGAPPVGGAPGGVPPVAPPPAAAAPAPAPAPVPVAAPAPAPAPVAAPQFPDASQVAPPADAPPVAAAAPPAVAQPVTAPAPAAAPVTPQAADGTDPWAVAPPVPQGFGVDSQQPGF